MSIVLSCPNCATRYRADAQAIGATGRKVRCTGCGHVWTAQGEEPEPIELGQDAVDDLFADEAPAAETSFEPEPEPEAKPHQAFRARVEARRRAASLAAVGGAWGGLAFMVAALFLCAAIFRVDIVNLWPRAASAYAAVGVEVNPFGYEIEPLTISRGEEAGQAVLIIEGAVRNIGRRDREAPALHGVLFAEDGAVLLDWPLPHDAEAVPAGESRVFRTVLADPPHAAVEAEIRLSGTSEASVSAASHGGDHAPDHAENAADAALR